MSETSCHIKTRFSPVPSCASSNIDRNRVMTIIAQESDVALRNQTFILNLVGTLD